jgi:hypothetical protein
MNLTQPNGVVPGREHHGIPHHPTRSDCHRPASFVVRVARAVLLTKGNEATVRVLFSRAFVRDKVRASTSRTEFLCLTSTSTNLQYVMTPHPLWDNGTTGIGCTLWGFAGGDRTSFREQSMCLISHKVNKGITRWSKRNTWTAEILPCNCDPFTNNTVPVLCPRKTFGKSRRAL